MKIIYDESSGFWTGKPYLVINDDGDPTLASFANEGDAKSFVRDEIEEITGNVTSTEKNAMEIPTVEKIETEGQARQTAIDWQHWQSEQSLSWGDMAKWGEFFSAIGVKFGLTEEFKENGIC